MFHILLLLMVIWMAGGAIATLRLAPITLSRVFLPSVLQVALLTSLILLRLGQLRRASLTYLAGTWLWATLIVSVIGGIHSHGLILYGTLPVSAAWLLGYEAALWTAGGCISTMLVFAILDMIGMVPPRIVNGTSLGIWFLAVQATLIGTIPVGQVIRRLLATLKELEAYKQNLELLVDERTAELVKARDEADSANRAKSVFLANMSHELRTPLNAILGFSHLLRGRGASQQQRHDLDIINRSGEHLLRLIDDVLDVAKLEAGCNELEIAPCDLGGLIKDATDMIRQRASQKGLELRVETPPSDLFIRTDSARLSQVLINLLNNAVKFTESGSVTLRVKATPANDRGVLLTFEVQDTGEGIGAGDQGMIFDPFVQVNAAKRHEGAGLGLAISRQIIALMGGTIRVESSPGRGSLFRMEIKVEQVPAPDVDQKNEFERPDALAPEQPEYRILIVEDQEENWMVLERLLENAGFQVRVAKNGAEGVQEFREWRPQLIWMDLRMPVMDGIEATRRIRASEGGLEVKIAAVTASGFASERSEILAEGMDDYVRKPYRPSEIFECLARHLAVRYRRSEDSKSSASNGQQIEGLTAEHLSDLPVELRNGLREAVITLDPQRISGAVELISRENKELGLILARYADRSAYSRIFAATDMQKSDQTTS
jgi:signal transduction histidine kinase/CheY-like chemotaxis protein